ncbi:FAD-dependent oxidoreductase [Maribius pontilimi]|uniref:FAD-dependent oxidoreductase n=1 Tax=Palleronia pontilimi TaxID=1964209 RepID=A0A934MB26_9RHOB|nr:FAD-dependent oxidoreductase [Palleronia pontilimi]MBJ3764282.1 FAD-dependent oxidoreductase [Palleronia pontilimi]
MSDLPAEARVVVIGGGVVGTSILYHLGLAGWPDCLLLERNELTAGSTWHAAGNVPSFSTDFAVLEMQRRSMELYRGLAERVDAPLTYNVTGSIRLAHDDRRMAEFARVRELGLHSGLPLELLSVDETVKRYPFLETHDLAGSLWDPHDGDIDPAGLTQALAKGARDTGQRIARFCAATGVRREGRAWIVEHQQGRTRCDIVVNAAGYYAGRVGDWFVPFGGRPVPMAVMAHQYLLTDEIPELRAWSQAHGGKLPLLRDPDTSYYLRQEKHGFNLGPYERACRAHWQGGDDPLPEDFSFQLFADDLDRLEPYIADAMARVPLLGTVGIRRVINGPIPYAPDGLPLLGPMPGVENAFEACAFTFGIAQGGGAGQILADWIVKGKPGWDCWSLDPRRFTEFTDPDYARDKAMEVYGHEYAMHFPHHHWPAGRDRKLSPAHDALRAGGAQMGAFAGWERATWFAQPGDDTSAAATQTWSRQGPWFDRVADEVRAASEGCGVLDLPGFSRFHVSGDGAEAWLDALLASRLPGPGRVSLGYALDRDGCVLSEFSVLRDGDGFTLISGAAAKWHDRDLLRAVLPKNGSVTVSDRSRDISTLIVCGARSRDVLSALTDADLSLPWLSHQPARVAGHDARLLRVCFAGELGWEIHAPMDAIGDIYGALRDAGATPFGMYALESMRLEKGYLAWKSEISDQYGARELGLDRFLDPAKATLPDPARRLVSLVVDGLDMDAPANAPVWLGDRIVGEVTSAGYGHRTGQAIVLAMVTRDATGPGTGLNVSVYGQTARGVVQPSPCLWDPANDRLRA